MIPPPLLFVHHPFLLFTPFSHPPESSCEFPSEEQVIALPPLPSPPTSLLSPSPSCFALSLSLSFSASAKHSTLSWSLAPGSLLSLLLSRSVAVWKERRVVAGKAGGRSQSRGRHSHSLSFFPPLLSFPVPSSHLQGVARTHSDFQILHLRLLDMIVTWFPSASFPSVCYSATVSLYLLCFSTIWLCPPLISTSLALPLPLFFSSAHFRFSLSLCLSLSEVRHTALYICCVSFCAAYQISLKALILFLIALPIFSSSPSCISVKSNYLYFNYLKTGTVLKRLRCRRD